MDVVFSVLKNEIQTLTFLSNLYSMKHPLINLFTQGDNYLGVPSDLKN